MEITDSDRTAIRFVIEQQLHAFQHDNADQAFAFASPAIQAQFRNPQTFMRMVKSGYAPVYRPRSVIFEGITTIEGNITQILLLLSPNGKPVRGLYLMEKQANQTWKINGCVLIPVDADIFD
ncbi:DUF4864 domain-containing protein [Calothrix sp. NIES-3974]|uniref:DUF4864 domain-containing protein n=1 Tax=Calothrix sp. NIES-3974 TaxID=2005462 RepID=UPI000B61E6B9|nr:DUF4864 domain-containing protein [Calothrix sp. NIES-3974]BAZ06388.1 hypothetical protein NIES3974_30490 [Calothrix sp. NIES-3974]